MLSCSRRYFLLVLPPPAADAPDAGLTDALLEAEVRRAVNGSAFYVAHEWSEVHVIGMVTLCFHGQHYTLSP